MTLEDTGSYTSVLAWTMLDLAFGLITASLPVLVGLVPHKTAPTRQLNMYQSNNPVPQGSIRNGAYLRSTTQKTVTARPNNRTGVVFEDSDSDVQGILAQHEIELISQG